MARKLIAKGYKKVYALKGGWREWFEAGYPVDEKMNSTIHGIKQIPAALKCLRRFMIGWNRLFFLFPALLNIPKPSAFWARLTPRI